MKLELHKLTILQQSIINIIKVYILKHDTTTIILHVDNKYSNE